MAEFCSRCDTDYDIDLGVIALELEPGYSEPVNCEGCNIRGVYKDDEGNLYLATLHDGEIGLEKVALEELMVAA